MITQKQINKYIKDIKKELLYVTKESRQFLKELKQNVTDYAEENQNADMAEVTEQFGKPEDIAATFFEQYSKDGIKRKVNIRRVVVVAVAVAVAIFSITMIIVIIDSNNSNIDHIYIGQAQEIELLEATDSISSDTNSTDTQS